MRRLTAINFITAYVELFGWDRECFNYKKECVFISFNENVKRNCGQSCPFSLNGYFFIRINRESVCEMWRKISLHSYFKGIIQFQCELDFSFTFFKLFYYYYFETISFSSRCCYLDWDIE